MTLNFGDEKVTKLYYGNTRVSDNEYEVIKTLYSGNGFGSTSGTAAPLVNTEYLSGKGILLDFENIEISNISAIVGEKVYIKGTSFFGIDDKMFIPNHLLSSNCQLNYPITVNDTAFWSKYALVTTNDKYKYVVPTDKPSISTIALSFYDDGVYWKNRGYLRLGTVDIYDSNRNKTSSVKIDSNITTPNVVKVELV